MQWRGDSGREISQVRAAAGRRVHGCVSSRQFQIFIFSVSQRSNDPLQSPTHAQRGGPNEKRTKLI